MQIYTCSEIYNDCLKWIVSEHLEDIEMKFECKLIRTVEKYIDK